MANEMHQPTLRELDLRLTRQRLDIDQIWVTLYRIQKLLLDKGIDEVTSEEYDWVTRGEKPK